MSRPPECETCGAPVDPWRAACRYCGSAYLLDALALSTPIVLSTTSMPGTYYEVPVVRRR